MRPRFFGFVTVAATVVILSFTKLQLSREDLLPLSQIVTFDSTQFDQNVVKIMEVDKGLAEALETGSTLTLRGEAEDGVVLCSADKTYDVKEAETSNSLLLLDGVTWPQEASAGCGNDNPTALERRSIQGVYHTYLEVKEMRPRLRRLFHLISEKNGQYPGGSGFRFEDLCSRIQCSETELRAGLAEAGAMEMDGKWYTLQADDKMRVLSLITNFIEENSWPLDGVVREETLRELAEIESRGVVEHVFDAFLDPTDGGGGDKYSLNAPAVSRFYGEYLLQTTGNAFNLAEFAVMWQQAVPEGVGTDVQKDLRGIALVDKKVVKYFPEWKLTENVQERLASLFAIKEKWTMDEIAPFVEKLTAPKLNVNALLTKYSRVSMINGVKHFSSKHGK